jgi:enamine deaminase RidA (YjgF/YER057c/UK114 family)
VSEIKRTGGGPYSFSQVVVHGDVVYLAGQVAGADGFDKPVREQIKMVFARIDELLAGAGSDRSKMLSVTVLLKDIGDFGVLNEEWDAWVDHDALPTRATFQAPLASPDILVELVVTAAL